MMPPEAVEWLTSAMREAIMGLFVELTSEA